MNNEYYKETFLALNCTPTFSFSKAHISELCLTLPHLPCLDAHQTVLVLSPESPFDVHVSSSPLQTSWHKLHHLTRKLDTQLSLGFPGLILNHFGLDSFHRLHPRHTSLPEFPEHDSVVSVEFLHMLNLLPVMTKCPRQPR